MNSSLVVARVQPSEEKSKERIEVNEGEKEEIAKREEEVGTCGEKDST